MNNLTKKSVLLVKACNLLLAEEMDNLKSTTAYKQDIKHLVNTLSKKLEVEYTQTYNAVKGEEFGLHYTMNLIEDFAEKLSSMRSPEDILTIKH